MRHKAFNFFATSCIHYKAKGKTLLAAHVRIKFRQWAFQFPSTFGIDKSTRFIVMSLRNTLNDDVWKDITELDDKKQRELLKWHLQAREPICKFADMQIGDHLIKRKSVSGKVLYYHHFLCIGTEGEGRPTIIHYFNTANNAFRRTFSTLSFGSGSALGQLGIVQEITLPHKDFMESESELQEKGAEVNRVVWPDGLRRFPSKEVNTF